MSASVPFPADTASTVTPPSATLPDIPYLNFGESVTLTNCDREPIHIPGHAQAHGVVVALRYDINGKHDTDSLEVVQVSANVPAYCGITPDELLGKDAAVLFDAEQIAIIRDAVAGGLLEANPLYLFTGPVGRQPSLFYVSAHTYQGTLVVELEPMQPSDTTAGTAGSASVGSVGTAPPTLRHALTHLRSASTLSDYCQAVCEAVQRISGFDRVMVYRFHDDGHGEVIAEAVSEADPREPYLGLHYPESDIPKQARALYLLNTIRLMPDALYTPAPMVPTINPITSKPLDMTHCVLRGYSRMYTEYLTNMGARASMSLAIVKDGQLWGLVACHHQTYRWIPYDVRTACEFLSDVVSLQIADKELNDEAGSRDQRHEIHRRLVEGMALHGNLLDGLTKGESVTTNVLTLVDAIGCAILSEGQLRLIGETPGEESIRAFARWLNQTWESDKQVWATDALSTLYPPGVNDQARAAGLLALRISSAPPDGEWILWFRPEVTQTVKWGGNPNKPYEVGKEEVLTPRKSFSLWRETVQGRSIPWKPSDLEAVRQLRTAIIEIIVRRAGELARLNTELSRSNEELDSFAYVASHDLKEPLRGISNYIRFLREDHGDELSAEADEKLDTLVRLTRRMDSLLDSLLHFSRLGRQNLAVTKSDLNVVLKEAVEAIGPRLRTVGMTVRVPRPLPVDIPCDPIQVGELFTNLLSNAAKYNDRPAGEKWVEVGWQEWSANNPKAPLMFYVRDNGIGIAEKHHTAIFRIFKRLHGRNEYSGGTGAGLTIAQKIVERHGGRLWLDSVVGEGTTFYFTLAPEPKE